MTEAASPFLSPPGVSMAHRATWSAGEVCAYRPAPLAAAALRVARDRPFRACGALATCARAPFRACSARSRAAARGGPQDGPPCSRPPRSLDALALSTRSASALGASTKRAFGCVSLAPGGRSVDGRETGLSAGRLRRAGRRAGLGGQECVGRAAAPRGHAGAAAAPSEAIMSEQSTSTRDVLTPERRTYCTVDVTCSHCGGLLYPNSRADAWECQACRLTRPRSSRDRFVTTLCQIEQSPTILEGGIDRGLPTSNERCPDCGHDRAYWDLKQLRAADESATLLFICTACEHTWRDAD